MSDSKPPLVTNVIVPAAYVPPVMNGNATGVVPIVPEPVKSTSQDEL